ncbi:hypothetical protein CMALT394_210112 [Carnobacterium maltaromaticum]|nr:hypothetical protein CMALT394_210112 [Carnobacterium maltaromaticum]
MIFLRKVFIIKETILQRVVAVWMNKVDLHSKWKEISLGKELLEGVLFL